jgi:catechol 2,3-dioxygenase-like lactoylglutathione lyase family enzyme
MKRFHLHLHVDDLAASVAFYAKLFAAEPTRHEPDYAKWMLEDPRINFAISTRGATAGVDHLGIQTDSPEELAELEARAQAADFTLLDAGETTCCYARSDKHWVTDPQGIAWEHFHTLANVPVFGESKRSADSTSVATGDGRKIAVDGNGACCANSAPRPQSILIEIKPVATKACC